MKPTSFAYRLVTSLKVNAGTVMPACIVIGMILPSIADRLNDWLYPAFIVPLMLSITRLEWAGQWRTLKRWPLMILASAWVLFGAPFLVWIALRGVAIPSPLFIALVLAAAAPPLTASGALAFFLRLDASLAIVATMLTMALTPFTLPPLALYLLGLELNIDLLDFMSRLAFVISVAFAGAYLIKFVFGQPRIDHHADFFDGIGLGFIGLFIIGLMSGVPELVHSQPAWVLLCLLSTALLVFFLNALGLMLFYSVQRSTALAIGLISGQANFGLLYLVLQDQVSAMVLSVFAIGQIPLYILPGLERWVLLKSGYTNKIS